MTPRQAAHNGMTPLHIAAEHGNKDFVDCLIEQGMDQTLRNNAGETPFVVAVRFNHLPVVKCFVNDGVEMEKPVDVNQKTSSGATPLCLAILKMDDEMAPPAGAKKGKTTKQALAMVKYLLDQGADVNLVGAGGQSPLFNAVFVNSFEAVEVLVKRGADTNAATSQERYTPLYVAAMKGYCAIVKYLVENGADKDAVIHDGTSVLIIAAYFGHLAVVRYLVERGANVEKVDDDGHSALQWARARRHHDVVDFLLKH